MLLAQVVNGVFLGHQALAATALPLLGMLGLVLTRGGLLSGGEVAVQRAADVLKHGLRARIAARLVALGPAYTRGQRAGELVYVAGEAVEALDAYVTRYLSLIHI